MIATQGATLRAMHTPGHSEVSAGAVPTLRCLCRAAAAFGGRLVPDIVSGTLLLLSPVHAAWLLLCCCVVAVHTCGAGSR